MAPFAGATAGQACLRGAELRRRRVVLPEILIDITGCRARGRPRTGGIPVLGNPGISYDLRQTEGSLSSHRALGQPAGVQRGHFWAKIRQAGSPPKTSDQLADPRFVDDWTWKLVARRSEALVVLNLAVFPLDRRSNGGDTSHSVKFEKDRENQRFSNGLSPKVARLAQG
ncbi:hypothetical protein SBV1_960069 [Verrucomicrobia bacterium]|nr:hypothetical protein SBV1_960069 [Verrucomicrobiota bacterium]